MYERTKNFYRLCFDPLGDRKHAFHHKHSTNKIQQTHTQSHAQAYTKGIMQKSCSLGIRSSFFIRFTLYIARIAIAFPTILFQSFFLISKGKDGVRSLNFVPHTHIHILIHTYSINENNVSAWLDAFNFCFIQYEKACANYILKTKIGVNFLFTVKNNHHESQFNGCFRYLRCRCW